MSGSLRTNRHLHGLDCWTSIEICWKLHVFTASVTTATIPYHSIAFNELLSRKMTANYNHWTFSLAKIGKNYHSTGKACKLEAPTQPSFDGHRGEGECKQFSRDFLVHFSTSLSMKSGCECRIFQINNFLSQYSSPKGKKLSKLLPKKLMKILLFITKQKTTRDFPATISPQRGTQTLPTHSRKKLSPPWKFSLMKKKFSQFFSHFELSNSFRFLSHFTIRELFDRLRRSLAENKTLKSDLISN